LQRSFRSRFTATECSPTNLRPHIYDRSEVAVFFQLSRTRTLVRKTATCLDFLKSISDWKSEIRDRRVEISNSETSVCGLSPVILSAQGCLTSELLRFL